MGIVPRSISLGRRGPPSLEVKMKGSVNVNMDVDLEKFVPAFVDGLMYEVSGTSADEHIYDSAVELVEAIDKEIADMEFTEKLIKRLLESLVEDYRDLEDSQDELIGLRESLGGIIELGAR